MGQSVTSETIARAIILLKLPTLRVGGLESVIRERGSEGTWYQASVVDRRATSVPIQFVRLIFNESCHASERSPKLHGTNLIPAWIRGKRYYTRRSRISIPGSH